MCSLNAQNQERAASAGGPELVVAAMRNPKAPCELIQCACLTLLNLAVDSTNQLKIVQAGFLSEKKITLSLVNCDVILIWCCFVIDAQQNTLLIHTRQIHTILTPV